MAPMMQVVGQGEWGAWPGVETFLGVEIREEEERIIGDALQRCGRLSNALDGWSMLDGRVRSTAALLHRSVAVVLCLTPAATTEKIMTDEPCRSRRSPNLGPGPLAGVRASEHRAVGGNVQRHVALELDPAYNVRPASAGVHRPAAPGRDEGDSGVESILRGSPNVEGKHERVGQPDRGGGDGVDHTEGRGARASTKHTGSQSDRSLMLMSNVNINTYAGEGGAVCFGTE